MEFEVESVQLLLIAQSQSAAAQFLELDWHQVHRIQAAAVQRGMQRRSTEQRNGSDSTKRGLNAGIITGPC